MANAGSTACNLEFGQLPLYILVFCSSPREKSQQKSATQQPSANSESPEHLDPILVPMRPQKHSPISTTRPGYNRRPPHAGTFPDPQEMRTFLGTPLGPKNGHNGNYRDSPCNCRCVSFWCRNMAPKVGHASSSLQEGLKTNLAGVACPYCSRLCAWIVHKTHDDHGLIIRLPHGCLASTCRNHSRHAHV